MNSSVAALPPSLRTAPDMAPAWLNLNASFDEAAEHFIARHRDDGDVEDLPVPDLRTWGIKAQDGHFALKPIAGHRDGFILRRSAFSTLATRLGAPTEFVRDTLIEPLQLATLNYLLMSSTSALPVHLRLRDGEVTAIVSDRYAPLEPDALVTTLRSALAQHNLLGDVRVRSIATGMVDVLRLVFPSTEVPVQVGDVSHVGFDVSSSCFGKSAVHLRGMVWRLACTNGLRVPSEMGKFSFRHVGDSSRLKNALEEAVPTALVHANGMLQSWQRAVHTYVNDVAASIARLHELSVTERDQVTAELKQERGVLELPERASLYEIANAITGAAHAAEPARRLEMETLAGALLQRELRRAS